MLTVLKNSNSSCAKSHYYSRNDVRFPSPHLLDTIVVNYSWENIRQAGQKQIEKSVSHKGVVAKRCHIVCKRPSNPVHKYKVMLGKNAKSVIMNHHNSKKVMHMLKITRLRKAQVPWQQVQVCAKASWLFPKLQVSRLFHLSMFRPLQRNRDVACWTWQFCFQFFWLFQIFLKI